MSVLFLQFGQTQEELVSPLDPGRQMLAVVGDQLTHFLQTSSTQTLTLNNQNTPGQTFKIWVKWSLTQF